MILNMGTKKCHHNRIFAVTNRACAMRQPQHPEPAGTLGGTPLGQPDDVPPRGTLAPPGRPSCCWPWTCGRRP